MIPNTAVLGAAGALVAGAGGALVAGGGGIAQDWNEVVERTLELHEAAQQRNAGAVHRKVSRAGLAWSEARRAGRRGASQQPGEADESAAGVPQSPASARLVDLHTDHEPTLLHSSPHLHARQARAPSPLLFSYPAVWHDALDLEATHGQTASHRRPPASAAAGVLASPIHQQHYLGDVQSRGVDYDYSRSDYGSEETHPRRGSLSAQTSEAAKGVEGSRRRSNRAGHRRVGRRLSDDIALTQRPSRYCDAPAPVGDGDVSRSSAASCPQSSPHLSSWAMAALQQGRNKYRQVTSTWHARLACSLQRLALRHTVHVP